MAALYDRNAPRRAVHLSLSEELLARAEAVLPNLSRTVEELLARHLRDEQARTRAEDETLNQVLSALNARHEEQGRLSDEFSNL